MFQTFDHLKPIPKLPHISLFLSHSNYPDLRVFGCLCFPNSYATTLNKLALRSMLCVFQGYYDKHKSYHCLDLVSGRVHVSRHVTVVEHVFPFATRTPPPDSTPSPPTPWRVLLPTLHIPTVAAPLPQIPIVTPKPIVLPSPVTAAGTTQTSAATAKNTEISAGRQLCSAG